MKGTSFKAVRLHGARERLFAFQIVMILIHISWPASIFISGIGVVRALNFFLFYFFIGGWRMPYPGDVIYFSFYVLRGSCS